RGQQRGRQSRAGPAHHRRRRNRQGCGGRMARAGQRRQRLERTPVREAVQMLGTATVGIVRLERRKQLYGRNFCRSTKLVPHFTPCRKPRSSRICCLYWSKRMFSQINRLPRP
ncbi:MAG: hypothetical protein P8130_00525, partial [Deltaproteobacteria bacterium]